jgi:ABC-type amino acid transport substrate-binding protein
MESGKKKAPPIKQYDTNALRLLRNQDLLTALKDKDWKAVMDDEVQASGRNKTWHLMPPDNVKNVIDYK